ncbi:MAG TPA: hypothetical protein VFI25_17640 [Planctomycetota bacterium]|jgi:hypothetical protein|nr:hypothetical protein [Planctomycetota bacterium]
MKRADRSERAREAEVVRQVERAIRRLEQGGDVVLKEAARVVETLQQAEKLFEGNGRLDMANSVRAARLSLSAHLAQFDEE